MGQRSQPVPSALKAEAEKEQPPKNMGGLIVIITACLPACLTSVQYNTYGRSEYLSHK